MKKRDEGTIHKLFALLLLLWIIICFQVFMEVMRAGYVSRYLEDCITQANLSALLIDPYHYGSTGELVFENVVKTRNDFSAFLEKGLGSEEARHTMGIYGETEILDFRVYEFGEEGTTEFIFSNESYCTQRLFSPNEEVVAPDGTIIQSSSIYAKIAIPVKFLFGIELVAIKEHCVDVVSEEDV